MRKSQSSKQGVTLAGARSINLLYNELRLLSTAPIALLAEEAALGENNINKDAFVASKNLSLLSRADELILEVLYLSFHFHFSISDTHFSQSVL